MTELKTLKDINCVHCNDTCDGFKCNAYTIHKEHALNSKELKEEAIKWLKSKHCRNFATTFDSDLFSNVNQAVGADKWIKHFFNITEEELQ